MTKRWEGKKKSYFEEFGPSSEPLSDSEMKIAYEYWVQDYRFVEHDQYVEKFLQVPGIAEAPHTSKAKGLGERMAELEAIEDARALVSATDAIRGADVAEAARLLASLDKRSLLREARLALEISERRASAELKGVKSSFQKLEQSELRGTIQLSSLQRAADAIGCDLVYAIRPKEKLKYSEVVWRRLMLPNINRGYLFNCVANRRPYALVHFVKQESVKLTEPSNPLGRRSTQEHK